VDIWIPFRELPGLPRSGGIPAVEQDGRMIGGAANAALPRAPRAALCGRARAC